MKLKSIKVNMVEVSDWDQFVSEAYGRPYKFQQQEGCKGRGVFTLTVPSEYACDDEMNEEIPEEINGEVMGVKFEKWLERDPKQPVAGRTDHGVELWWSRNFYPDVHTLANDLHKKGLLEAGDYCINIDW